MRHDRFAAALTLSAERSLLRKIVANGRRRHAGLAHGIADLIQADDHVAGGVKPRHARSLVGFDLDAAFIGYVRTQLLRKVRMGRRSERSIDGGGEGASSVRRRID